MGMKGVLYVDLKVRTFQDDDEPSVIAIWQELLADLAPHNDPALAIRNKLAVDRELFFVAVLDSTVVGISVE